MSSVEATRGNETSNSHVLVVDDEEILRDTYQRVLSKLGYSVTTVDSAEQALGMIRAGSFDVIVSDIWMRGMDGVNLLKAIRERDLDVPVILMTGAPSIDTAVKAIEYGALRYLAKPMNMAEFQQAVTQAVWLHRLAKLKREAVGLAGTAEHQLGDRASLESCFQGALSKIWMAFQPIVHYQQRRVFAFEALVRSNEPLLPHPGALFDAAERLRRIIDLGRAIRERVGTAWPDAPRDALLFVNLHTKDLDDELLYSEHSPLAHIADRIVLEITERAALETVKEPVRRVAKLRELGYRIAIDDLGAGYAGLSSFAQLVPDLVKLDMTLVRNIHQDPVRKKIIGGMLSICRQLNMDVIAEGVETEAERAALVELGCELFQGYLFAKPAAGFPSVQWS